MENKMLSDISRLNRILALQSEGYLVDISEISEQCWQGYTVLMQAELYDIINQEGCWLMVPTGVDCEYECEQLIICVWQHLRFYPEFFDGGKPIYIPITLSTIKDLMVITELFLCDNDRVIIITLTNNADIALFY